MILTRWTEKVFSTVFFLIRRQQQQRTLVRMKQEPMNKTAWGSEETRPDGLYVYSFHHRTLRAPPRTSGLQSLSKNISYLNIPLLSLPTPSSLLPYLDPLLEPNPRRRPVNSGSQSLLQKKSQATWASDKLNPGKNGRFRRRRLRNRALPRPRSEGV